MTYRAPVRDMIDTIRHAAGFDAIQAQGLYGELGADLIEQVLDEAGRFAADRLAPLNRVGDTHGATFADGVVTTAPGWKEAYGAWAAAGWNAVAGPPEWGGQGLPLVVQVACAEMWNSACMAFSLAPLLTSGAIEALSAHATPELKRTYLEKLVAGVWTGTMNLTEPQAGSDLSALRARAVPASDGSYRVTGQKIFITYGEHDMTDNIVHLVLARLPDAPPGTRGISLFLVPKFLVNPDGSLGARNDVRCASIEHKLGVHASPTCVMAFGDEGGAVGYLIGEENRGLACMFTMMNNARLSVGIQGVAIAERAFQQALAYAQERRQGRAGGSADAMSAIVAHPDVQRMLMTMKALTAAARAICYRTAAALDGAHLASDPATRAAAHAHASLLTPVAKAFSTDIGVEVASLGVQIHGGMGFIEETGAAQHLRDARIAPIYEGTNGIQAIDLVARKLPVAGGETVRAAIAAMRVTAARATNARVDGLGTTAARLRDAAESLDRATAYMLKALAGNAPDDALAGAAPYLRLFGLAEGLSAMTASALAAHEAMAAGDTNPAHAGRIALTRFFAENVAPAASGLEQTVLGGAPSVQAAPLVLAG
ncbi:acyl-CoA dehydrogenase [Chelatococcus reniformis]|uniref:3-methylmercaptopropionyl-CoA dehydrogenase n=1 Tax=Chelatococcus reniformis TaxID=1494448 RepID=A0A916XCS7_9HYPH|nr:acyl-CoA dehydrogenase [Chelatococcus reniformis]GGC62366.1 acyl-CoA dehydrogenase [Chelatococcus reniformis]